jgi:hypothetical protein
LDSHLQAHLASGVDSQVRLEVSLKPGSSQGLVSAFDQAAFFGLDFQSDLDSLGAMYAEVLDLVRAET